MITGDLAHHPVQFEELDWASEPDVDPAAAIATRRRFAERYRDGHTIVLGTHFGGPSCGRLVAQERGYRVDPTGFPDIGGA